MSSFWLISRRDHSQAVEIARGRTFAYKRVVYHHFHWTAVSAYRNALSAEYEPLQPFFLMALAQECRTFLDVGANIGMYALFATLLPQIEKCIAFEPNPETARELRKNIALNNAKIETIEAAVSDQAGEVTFGVVNDYAGNNAVVSTALRDRFSREITVPAMTLDSISDLPEPICIKIDVEGHERQVLGGATSLLARHCILQVENFDSAVDGVLPPGYSKLTNIGPDHYFTNIEGLCALETYERAARDLITSNHEAARSAPQYPISVRRGDFTLQIAGRSADKLRKARRLLR